MPSRVTPSEVDDAPPPAAPAQARVYGRAMQLDDIDADDRREAAPPPPDRPAQPKEPVDKPPNRISGRASASASVAPPGGPRANEPLSPADARPDDPFDRPPQASRPYADPTTDVAGRGRAHVPPRPRPEYYGELTTDISHRGPGGDRSSAAAMPAWPPREPADLDQDRERPRMGGVFPGPATSPAAPGADQSGGWPPYTDADQGAFDRFNAAADESDQFRAEQPNRIKPSSGSGHVRMLPVLLSVVIGAILLVGIAIGIVWLISRGSDSGFNVSAGDCVRRAGSTAVKASCSDAGAYRVVSVADTKDQCPDRRQPYVVNPTKDGKTQVLCLKPSGG